MHHRSHLLFLACFIGLCTTFPAAALSNISVQKPVPAGVGLRIESRDGSILVVTPIPFSPSEEAGIRAKDTIIAINGVPVAGKTADEVLLLLRGPENSRISITINRSGILKTYQLTRSFPRNPSIVLTIKSRIPVVRITEFNSNLDSASENIFRRVQALHPQTLILDLRNNGGGSIDSIKMLLGKFLEKGTTFPVCAMEQFIVDKTTSEP